MKLYRTGAMESLRKWFYKPKRDDRSLLAQFFFADDALNMIAAELDSFDGRKDPERCSTLVAQLRNAQDRVLNITTQIMDQLLGNERIARGFRVKFPEDVLHDNLAGQLWFGAECLAAGSSIMNREEESAAMRPLAKALTRSLETVRGLLREHCLRNNQYNGQLCVNDSDEILHESLKIFDRLFAEFELCYVSAMVPVKTPQEFEVQQLICVLFSETVQRSLKIGLLTQEQVDDYDPASMFAIPRLAIVSGLLIYSNGPLSIVKPPEQMSDMFRPFRTLLHKIRELLWTLDRKELLILEKLLCTNEDISNIATLELPTGVVTDTDTSFYPDINEFITKFTADNAHCKELLNSNWKGSLIPETTIGTHLTNNHEEGGDCFSNALNETDYLPDNMEVFTPILDGMRRLSEMDNPAPSSTKLKRSNAKKKKHNMSVLPQNEDHDICIDRGKEGIDSREVNTFQWMTVAGAETESEFPSTSNTLRAESRSSLRSSNSRKHSRNETNDFAIRSLSSNGLSMFDPLAASTSYGPTVNPTQNDNNVLLPDQNLVDSLSEQVSEIVDKLSVITYENAQTESSKNSLSNIQNQTASQMHSYSTNDVFMSKACEPEFPIDFNTIMSEAVSNMPSTSHGFLIPNAISQEPAILASLSHNNSAIFDEDPVNLNGNNRTQSSSDLLDTEISSVNVNLSSLILTKEEFESSFPQGSTEDLDVKKTDANDEVRFTVGYENDTIEIGTPGDSGVCTENTSLDRSPDSEHSNRDLNRLRNNISNASPQNVTETNNKPDDIPSNNVTVELSTVKLEYEEHTGNNPENEAVGSSPVDFVQSDLVSNCVNKSDSRTLSNSETRAKCDINVNDSRSESDVVILNESVQGCSARVKAEAKKSASAKHKKKATKPRRWSPGCILIANHSNVSNNSNVKLNLDQFVEDSLCSSLSSATSSFHSECADDEEIALALQAQELAARYQTRAKFTSSEDLIHRLFVCIAGVADQLQTNFAADLRNILKSVFLMNQTQEEEEKQPEEEEENGIKPSEEDPARKASADYEVSGSEVIATGGSFDSIYSAEEVHADSSPERDVRLNESAVDEHSSGEESSNGRRLIRHNSVNVTMIPKNSDADNHDDVFESAQNEMKLDEGRTSLETSAEVRMVAESRNVRSQSVTHLSEESGCQHADRTPVEMAPDWVPDMAAPDCMRCGVHFTAFRRRHHCRNCGKVFCASCSANSIPLPRFGQMKPVRVCEECFRRQARKHRHHHHR